VTVRADAQKSVTYERDDDGIGWITLRRERVLNAIDSAMMRDLASALDAFDKDDSAQVAVMSGSGRAFCVGADIKEVRTHVAQDGESDLKRLPDLLLVRDRYKPIVAAAHGHVVGAGLRLVLLSDFALCAGSTQFRVPEVDHGLDGAPYWLLLQARAGDAFAADVVGTCRTWSGAEAAARGVVIRATAEDQLVPDAKALARQLAGKPPAALAALVRARRTALRRLELDAWSSRDPALNWANSPSAAADPS
jgi:enoyl-CoA hydratase/carnithine racemase